MANYTVTVTVVNSGGNNVFAVNGNPQATLGPYNVNTNDVITFDLSDSSLTGNPFGLGPDPANTANAYTSADGVVYRIGATTYPTFSDFQTAYLQSIAGAEIVWTLSAYNAATVGYFSGQTTGIGGTIDVQGTVADSTAPANEQIIINNGATTTGSRTVQCALSATDTAGVSGYFISETNNTPSLALFTPVPAASSFSETVPFTITGSIGAITIYAWFRDRAGNISSPATSSITLQTTTLSYAITGVRGPKGDTGATGQAATVTVGNVTTLAAGQQATIANTGTQYASVLDFNIPKGDQGVPGEKGESGGFLIRHKFTDYYTFLAVTTQDETNLGFGPGDIGVIGGSESAAEYGQMYLFKGYDSNGNGLGENTTPNAAWQYLVDLSVQGVQGPPGANASIQLASTHNFTNDPANAGVVNLGTQQNAEFQFTLPRGLQGLPGPEGPTGNGVTAASVVGQTVTFTYSDGSQTDVTIPAGPPGADGLSITGAVLNDVDPNYNLVLTFTDESTQTVTFAKPSSGSITVGNVTALAEGATPTVVDTNTSDASSAVLDFGIPVGATGGPGPQGSQGIGIDTGSLSFVPGSSGSQYRITLLLDDPSGNTSPSPVTIDFDVPADGTDGVSITGVQTVDPDTIRFALSNNTYTSNVDLPRGLTGASGSLSINTVTTLIAGSAPTVALDATSTLNADGDATNAVLNWGIPNGKGIASMVLGNHPTDSTQYRITVTFDDVNSTTTNIDFAKPVDGVDGGGANQLNDLSDVVITGTPSSGQIIQHNGVNFVNTTDPSLINAIALG